MKIPYLYIDTCYGLRSFFVDDIWERLSRRLTRKDYANQVLHFYWPDVYRKV